MGVNHCIRVGAMYTDCLFDTTFFFWGGGGVLQTSWYFNDDTRSIGSLPHIALWLTKMFLIQTILGDILKPKYMPSIQLKDTIAFQG